MDSECGDAAIRFLLLLPAKSANLEKAYCAPFDKYIASTRKTGMQEINWPKCPFVIKNKQLD